MACPSLMHKGRRGSAFRGAHLGFAQPRSPLKPGGLLETQQCSWTPGAAALSNKEMSNPMFATADRPAMTVNER